MKTTIYRITEKEVVDVCRSFFERRFIDHQLSRPGQWAGMEAQKLKFSNPVSFAALFNLFSEREAYDVISREATKRAQPVRDKAQAAAQADKLAGWKMILNSGESLSTLWALGHKVGQERMAKAHMAAVENAIAQLQRSLGSERGFKLWQQPTRPLFATFFAGADRQQCPCVHTIVLIPRRHLSHDGKISEISEGSLEKAHKEVDAVYSKSLRDVFGDDQILDLPRSSLRVSVPGNGSERLVMSGHLFSEWRKVAREAGENAIEKTLEALKGIGIEEPKPIEKPQTSAQLALVTTEKSNGHQANGNPFSQSH